MVKCPEFTDLIIRVLERCLACCRALRGCHHDSVPQRASLRHTANGMSVRLHFTGAHCFSLAALHLLVPVVAELVVVAVQLGLQPGDLFLLAGGVVVVHHLNS